MNYNEFIATYNGKGTDYDGGYGVQCVDFIKLYLDKVFGIKPGAWGDAKYYWINFNKHPELVANFTRIANTPSFVPKKGDIMVWKGSLSGSDGCGHVAVCDGVGNTSYFYSYDQNWQGKAAKRVKHNYNSVYGVLRPKDQSKITGVVEVKKNYFKKYTGTSNSIVDALKAIGATSTFAYRGKIAKANGITKVYMGYASQNTKMLNLLKQGKLIKP